MVQWLPATGTVPPYFHFDPPLPFDVQSRRRQIRWTRPLKEKDGLLRRELNSASHSRRPSTKHGPSTRTSGCPHALAAHFIERHGHSPFLVGNRDETLRMIRAYDPTSVIFTVYAVQPGLSAGGLAQNVWSVMAAANDSLTSRGVDLRWLISA